MPESVLVIVIDGAKAERGLNSLERGLNKTTRAGDKTDKEFKKLTADSKKLAEGAGRVTSAFKAIAAAAAIAGATALFTGMIKEAGEAERQLFRLNAIVMATGGAAGFTGAQFDKMARDVARSTLASVEGVQGAIGILATFKSVAGDVFGRTIELSQDMAAVMGQDIKNAALQLGKALEDPATGLTALRRSGVSFTQQEKDLISTLFDSGKAFEAQSLILDKIQEQVGGTGRAEAGGLAGAVDTLGQNWDELLQSLGETGPLQESTKWINALADGLKRIQADLVPTGQLLFNQLIAERENLEEEIANAGFFRNTLPLERRLNRVNQQIKELSDAKIKILKEESAILAASKDKPVPTPKKDKTKVRKSEFDTAKQGLENYIKAQKEAEIVTGKTEAQVARLNLEWKIAEAMTKAKTAAEREQIAAAGAIAKQQLDITLAVKEDNEIREKARELVAETRTEQQQYNAILRQYNELRAEGILTDSEYIALLDALKQKFQDVANAQKTTGEAMADGAKDYVDSFESEYDRIRDVASRAFSSMEDSLLEFTKTGKFNFTSLIDSMVADISRLAIQESITKPLAKMMFSGGGTPTAGNTPASGGSGFLSGVDDFFSGLFGFANGGRIMPGGIGGSDSQVVAFKKSPEEDVLIRTPSQQKGNGGEITIINKISVVTPTGIIPEATQRQLGSRVGRSIQESLGRNG